MALRKRTIRQMSPVARKVARLVNDFQSATRRLKYLLGDIQDLEFIVRAQSFDQEERDDVFPKSPRGSNTENLPSRKKYEDRDDHMGKPRNRRGAANRRRTIRPRNKRKRFKKGANAL